MKREKIQVCVDVLKNSFKQKFDPFLKEKFTNSFEDTTYDDLKNV